MALHTPGNHLWCYKALCN